MKKINFTLIVLCLSTIVFGQKWEWSVQNLGNQYHFKSMQFINSNIGFLCGVDSAKQGGVLFKTTNGGNNWVKVQEYKNGIFDVYFTSENKGHLAADSGFIFTSLDGGKSIKHINAPDYRLEFSKQVNRILFVDSLKGYAFTDGGFVRETTDGGVNWKYVPYGVITPYVFHDAQIVSDSLYVGIGCEPTTLGGATWFTSDAAYTPNAGSRWTVTGPANTPKYHRIFGLHMQSANFAVTVGLKGGIRISKDLFKSYSANLSSITTDLYDVNFIGGNVGWAVGAEGVFIMSKDSGYTWSADTTIGNRNINRLFSVGETSWACGDYGQVFKTTKKAGVSVEEQQFSSNNIKLYPNPSRGNINFTAAIKIDRIEIIDIRGRIMKTQNNPVHSLQLAALPDGFYFIRFYAENNIVTKKIVLRK